MSSAYQYVKDRRREKRAREMGSEQLEVTAPAVAALQGQITAMSEAFDNERESWRERDRLRGERISELESELGEVTARLREAQATLTEVNEKVAGLTQRLSELADKGKE